MGNSNSQEVYKDLFEKLDKDGTGRLNLQELLSADLPELEDTKSAMFLFRFDRSKEGSLTYDDFSQVLRHYKQLQEKTNRNRVNEINNAKKNSFLDLRKLLKKKEEKKESPSRVWKTLDLDIAKGFSLKRDTATPIICGVDRGISSSSDSSLDNSSNSIDEEYEDNFEKKSKEEQEDVLKSNEFLSLSLNTEEGRSQFMEWLFCLADVDKSERINVEELCLFLKSLAKDQINTLNLLYDEDDNEDNNNNNNNNNNNDEDEDNNKENSRIIKIQDIPLLSKQIMLEYDTGETGFLNRQEFMVLADLIAKNYFQVTTKRKKHKNIGCYEFQWKLGEGSAGCVHAAVHKQTNKSVAIKVIPKGEDVSDLSRIDTEIKAMLMLKHENIVKLIEVLEDEKNVYFVMELCGGGTIADYVAIKPISDSLARYYFKQLIDAVIYCHEQGICHRDLKLENLLLDNKGILHVSDFGQAGIFSTGWDVFSTAVGSLFHLAPEQILGQAYSGEKIDTWACGVVLYRMLVGRPPFYDSSVQKIIDSISNVNYSVPDYISAEAADLISLLLKFDPKERLPLKEVLCHKWFQGTTQARSLALHQYLITSNQENNTIWDDLVTLVHSLDITCVSVVKSKQKPNCINKIKCHYPSKHLKFSISLMNPPDQQPSDSKLKKSKKKSKPIKRKKSLKLIKKSSNNLKLNKSVDSTNNTNNNNDDDDDNNNTKSSPRKKSDSPRKKLDSPRKKLSSSTKKLGSSISPTVDNKISKQYSRILEFFLYKGDTWFYQELLEKILSKFKVIIQSNNHEIIDISDQSNSKSDISLTDSSKSSLSS
eukprot:TRINITY_DN1551_c0_g1_i2.p1 TRINITY_DN1551_c0_g1~~TRINITY_DN1551_c0_g1_i2.p1  ORF type:complete len:819 (+),score=273.23 TRINITY_DN1551_c0_g1_i2:81-2537(+)